MSLFWYQLKGELYKMLMRRRTFIGFGAFLLLEILILVIYQLKDGNRLFERIIKVEQGQEMVNYFLSGTTLALFILGLSNFLLGALYLALVAGDVVAKESEDGTLRLLLTRPISRWRVLFIKWLSCAIYNCVLIAFIGVSAWILGGMLRGYTGGMVAFSPDVRIPTFFGYGEGLTRYALSLVTMSISMLSVTTLAFFLSCFKIKPAVAAIATLSYFFIEMILLRSGFMDSYKHYLITTHADAWFYVFSQPFDWASMLKSYAYLFGVNLTLFFVGGVVFQLRDFKT